MLVGLHSCLRQVTGTLRLCSKIAGGYGWSSPGMTDAQGLSMSASCRYRSGGGRWRRPVAAAFAALVGPAGTRRTLASARSAWYPVQRFVHFLARADCPPASPGELVEEHVKQFLTDRGRWGMKELEELRLLFRQEPLASMISSAVHSHAAQRINLTLPPRSGYSDGEFAALTAAARRDVAALRDRIDHGEAQLATWQSTPEAFSAEESEVMRTLAGITETGVVPRIPVTLHDQERIWRTQLAQQIFVTRSDREPLLVLMAALSGRNAETIKELPVEHRILDDGRAVELLVVKRRRGPQRWYDTVTWEIGPPHRELHTPGGLYLLMHRLMARGRALTGSQSVWSVWRNGRTDPPIGSLREHHDPFARRLDAGLEFRRWAATHDLRADPLETDGPAPALAIDMGRIRTSVEVRRTRRLGGHLPSSVRSNTTNVLFSNYLQGDPTVKDWAEDVVSDAVRDAEQSALAAHRNRIAELVVEPDAQDTDLQHGAWTACTDPEQRPETGRPCRDVSFLDCFHCANALITRTHLPALVALIDTLTRRRTTLGDNEWWQRYGSAWAAIRYDVLPKFTPEEVDAAAEEAAQDKLLEVAEDPWERP